LFNGTATDNSGHWRISIERSAGKSLHVMIWCGGKTLHLNPYRKITETHKSFNTGSIAHLLRQGTLFATSYPESAEKAGL